jgi:Zn-dependent protease with chaperone function
VGWEARVQKKKDIGPFIVSVFLAPVLGLLVSWVMLAGLGEPGQSIEGIAKFCSYPQDFPNRDCTVLHEAIQLRNLALLALGVTILLPLGYWLAVLVLARNRAALGRGFPVIVRICLVLLPVILVGHAALVALDTLNLYQLGLFPRSGLLMVAVGLVVFGLLLSAFNILAGMRTMLTIEPLRVTGILVDEQRSAALHARARALAQKLGAVAPRQIVAGIEPTPFMTSMPVRLRGSGDLPAGETLYVSTLALQVLDDGELDAILAQELAHFRGPDLVFSRKFAPAHAGLVNAVESVSDDSSESPWMRIARLPAFGLLAFMLWVVKGRLGRAHYEREELADRGALEVTTAPRLISAVAKLTALGAQWPLFRQGLTSLMNRGVGRRNIAQDYLSRTRTFLANTDQAALHSNLSKMATPHPVDVRPSLGARAYALQVDEKPIVVASVIALRAQKPVDPGLRSIEEEVTAADLDYTRVPGHPIEISEGEALPEEIAF